jgi:hypothetical protein
MKAQAPTPRRCRSPHRALSIGHRLLQLKNGAVAQRCHARSDADGSSGWACPDGARLLCRNRPGLSAIAGVEPILVITALLSVFIVLGILYESLVHPLTIISTLPSASVGAMLALMLFTSISTSSRSSASFCSSAS